MEYQQLKRFCSENKSKIELLVGHSIRCQDKAIVLKSYHDLIMNNEKKETQDVDNDQHLEFPEISKKYKFGVLLGKGGFGAVYQGTNKKKPHIEVAIKISKSPGAIIKTESEYYYLKLLQGLSGIPKIIAEPIKNSDYYAIIMEKLGSSLKNRYNDENANNLPPLESLAIQMINLIESVHNEGIIHRDVTPGNFVFGLRDESDKLFLIDFGLSVGYLNEDGTHMPYRTDFPFKGTYCYVSANIQEKIESSRRDDMISLGYTLASLFIELPWREKALAIKKIPRNKQKAIKHEIIVMKRATKFPADLPASIRKYINIVSKLKFDEKPNYNKLKKLFK